MQTRSRSGILKPKLYHAELLHKLESTSVALTVPLWKRGIEDDIRALQSNGMLTLVPPNVAPHVVQSKWDFRTKPKADGALDKYKAQLVANANPWS